MDPLSIAGHISGLLTLADGIVRFCYLYGTALWDDKKEAQAITNEVGHISALLHALQPFIHNSQSRFGQGLGDEDDNTHYEKFALCGELSSCAETLKEISAPLIKDFLVKENVCKSAAKVLQWPYKRIPLPLQALLDRLSRHSARLSVAFSAFSR